MATKSRAGTKKSSSKSYRKAAAQPMPYGAPISDAIKRGDRAEMRRQLSAAKKILKDNAALQKAVDKLEAALKG
jgi:hypothetical protein